MESLYSFTEERLTENNFLLLSIVIDFEWILSIIISLLFISEHLKVLISDLYKRQLAAGRILDMLSFNNDFFSI